MVPAIDPMAALGPNEASPEKPKIKGALPGPMGHLGDKADLTPSPLRVSGSHRGGLTGETNDVVRCYVFALTEQASVTLLLPRRNHCSPLNRLWQLVPPGNPDWQVAGE